MSEEENIFTLLRDFCSQNKLYNFEGESGLGRFEQVIEAMGYKRDGFRFGDPIQKFLADNPGAITSIIEWIEDNSCEEWEENLKSHL